MKIKLLLIVVAICIFALSAVLSYLFKYERASDSNSKIHIKALEDDLQSLEDQIQALQNAEELIPVEQNWLAVQKIIDRYPDLIWQASEDLELSTNTENAWGAVMIASPDLLLPLMRLIQRTVPAEVSEIQLERQQGVLFINILGILE